MSFMDSVKDAAGKVPQAGANASGGWDNLRQHLNDSIRKYMGDRKLEDDELKHAQESKKAEERRINEKQIRTLRRSNRAHGASLLGVGAQSADMGDQLGG